MPHPVPWLMAAVADNVVDVVVDHVVVDVVDVLL